MPVSPDDRLYHQVNQRITDVIASLEGLRATVEGGFTTLGKDISCLHDSDAKLRIDNEHAIAGIAAETAKALAISTEKTSAALANAIQGNTAEIQTLRDRVYVLESFRGRVMGTWTTVSLLIGGSLQWIISSIFGHKH